MLSITLKSGKQVKVKSTRTNKPASWKPSGESYRVTVQYNRKSFSFDFWDSYDAMIKGKDCDERSAVACWASDAFIGMNTQDAADIMSEFGYTDPKEARRVLKGVKRAEEQAGRVGMSEEDIQELADY